MNIVQQFGFLGIDAYSYMNVNNPVIDGGRTIL
jgi:hypothetical protein